MTSYTPTVKSDFEITRKDGPGINTSILELIDNSIGWGDATDIEIAYDNDRNTLVITDNGNGFGALESLNRFFRKGTTNSNISSSTIGKYGMGGYRACINIGEKVVINTNINDTRYCCGTDFIDMSSNNSWKPTMDITDQPSESTEKNTTFVVTIRSAYHNAFNSSSLKKEIIRAFHHHPEKITFTINDEKFTPCELFPYNDTSHLCNKSYAIRYNIDTNVFESIECNNDTSDSEDDECDNENGNYITLAHLNIIILKNMLKSNKFLGSSPGIDFYRCNRLCNTRNPIRNLGGIGENLSKGEMRGGRCHMQFLYTDKRLTDSRSMDDELGLSTWKEINENNKEISESLLDILESKALEINNIYEVYVNEKKSSFGNHIINELNNLNKSPNILDELANVPSTAHNLLEYREDINNKYIEYTKFKNFKTWYYDLETSTYKYSDSKASVKKDKETKDANTVRRNSSNFKAFIKMFDILEIIKVAIDNIIKNNKIIEDRMVLHGTTREDAIQRIEIETEIRSVDNTLSFKENLIKYNEYIDKYDLKNNEKYTEYYEEVNEYITSTKKKLDIQLSREENERLANEERRAKIEKDRLAKIEKDRLAKIEKDRLAKIEKDRLAKIEKDRLAKIEKDRLAKIEKLEKEKHKNKLRLSKDEKDKLKKQSKLEKEILSQPIKIEKQQSKSHDEKKYSLLKLINDNIFNDVNDIINVAKSII